MLASIEPCSTWECINSFGDWFAAAGTVLTATLALWLAVRDRRISVKAVLSLGLVPGADPRTLDQRVFALDFTNLGPRTVTFTNHVWHLPFQGRMVLFPYDVGYAGRISSRFPLELSDGKSGHVFYHQEHFKKLDDPESVFFHKKYWTAWFRIWFFRLYLTTSVGKRVRVKVNRHVRKNLWAQYRAA